MKKTILAILFSTMAASAISQKEICLPAIFGKEGERFYVIHEDCKEPEKSFKEFLDKMNLPKNFSYWKEGKWYFFIVH